MGVSPITNTIYYGAMKGDEFVGDKEDITTIAVRAVFEWFIQKLESESPDGAFQVRFPQVPYVLEMRRESGENE